jgi:hypothetical protein
MLDWHKLGWLFAELMREEEEEESCCDNECGSEEAG